MIDVRSVILNYLYLNEKGIVNSVIGRWALC